MKVEEKSGKLIVKKRNKIILVNLNEIVYIERTGTNSVINTFVEEIPINITLKELENLLSEDFVRVHRSFIVNKLLLKELNTLNENTYEAVFSEEKTALVNRKLINLIW
ncbi:LytTR family DNA-binding domain-containing protein [Neobacillus niacini]|uniref:LytTR family DNA-binding domain-containing protein n=1 Tax=Neobacillus niacini TaxID=86668 RepID=UPI00286063CA|nr:LytTR family DNA-binding domain-containing protein [Neobacillus niacini]MDR6999447.1 two-component system LytT family response regulator [Neobacillus niacini]